MTWFIGCRCNFLTRATANRYFRIKWRYSRIYWRCLILKSHIFAHGVSCLVCTSFIRITRLAEYRNTLSYNIDKWLRHKTRCYCASKRYGRIFSLLQEANFIVLQCQKLIVFNITLWHYGLHNPLENPVRLLLDRSAPIWIPQWGGSGVEVVQVGYRLEFIVNVNCPTITTCC